ncbi:hypothetical protein [Nesterenkonia massiliensis]|uniref:hypothetical protein n=1 Tax=Nesterenkonia massiliensis TaxID=1232429 RepID=UPI000412EE18|nr:hypothetical protein [Nesterenkonia massiliensis]
MAVNLHHLRLKIAAAAMVKGIAWRATRLPGPAGTAAAHALTRASTRLTPEGEATGSYRGLLAGLLQDALRDHHTDDDAAAVSYDPVAGLVPAAGAEPVPDLPLLRQRAEQDPRAGNLLALAAAHRKSYIAEFEASAEFYERAFAANPKDLRAIEGILSSGARSHFDFARIWTYVHTLRPTKGTLSGADFWDPVEQLFAADPSTTDSSTAQPTAAQIEAAEAVLAAHEQDLPDLHQLLLEALAVRLQFLGAFLTGTMIRRAMAQNRVNELRGIPLESALWVKHLMGAYAYLEQDQRLERIAAKPPVDRPHKLAHQQVDKLRADAALWTGDAAPLQELSLQRAAELELPGEQRMRQLVLGRRVAVVGPAATAEEVGELIDAHDVVVRPRFTPEYVQTERVRIGSRTDIAYYSGLDLTRGWEQIERSALNGDFQLAVTRPLYWPVLAQQQLPPQWLRAARFEFGLYFRGAPLGLQRILYDLLQFAPAELSLFHADFYASPHVLRPGYRAADSSVFGPHSPMNDPVVMHDLSFEFRFTQRLVRSGLVTAHGTAGEVLTLSEAQYLERLEQLSPLGRRVGRS